MPYGFESYDDNGRLQFTTEDPGMYVDSFTESKTSVQSGGDGFSYYYIDLLGINQEDLIIARPIAGQGFIGMLAWETGGTTRRRLYTSGLIKEAEPGTDTLAESNNFGTNDIKWAVVKDATAIVPATSGYGLEVYNESSELTFTSNLESPAAWLNIIGVLGRNTDNTTGSGLRLHELATPTNFDNTYGLMNGHEFTFGEAFEDPSGDARHTVHCRSYYWNPTNQKIYAAAFNFTPADPIDYTLLGWKGAYSYPDTLTLDYYAVQAI